MHSPSWECVFIRILGIYCFWNILCLKYLKDSRAKESFVRYLLEKFSLRDLLMPRSRMLLSFQEFSCTCCLITLCRSIESVWDANQRNGRRHDGRHFHPAVRMPTTNAPHVSTVANAGAWDRVAGAGAGAPRRSWSGRRRQNWRWWRGHANSQLVDGFEGGCGHRRHQGFATRAKHYSDAGAHSRPPVWCPGEPENHRGHAQGVRRCVSSSIVFLKELLKMDDKIMKHWFV